MRHKLSVIPASIRAHDWWDYKLPAILEIFVASALVTDTPIAPLAGAFALLVVALLTGAIFASLVNDLTDHVDDQRAGKPIVLAQLPEAWRVVFVLAPVIAGTAFLWLWHDDPALCGVYLAAWLAFVAYSVRPVRLKARGGWGVVVMGLGEAALPSLVATLLFEHAAGKPVDLLWIAAVGLWSFCHGVRAILWHQLGDDDADRAAAVATFVQRRGAAFAKRIVARYVFPAELVALAAMLAMMAGVAPVIALILYAVVVRLRMRLWHNVPVVVGPVPEHLLLMQDYYLGYMLLAIVATAALRHPQDIPILAVFLLLFPGVPVRVTVDTVRLAMPAARLLRYWVAR